MRSPKQSLRFELGGIELGCLIQIGAVKMAILKYRTRPEAWPRHRERAKYAWLIPFFAIEWVWNWLAYWLSGWAFLEVLEYLGTLSLLLAVVSYFAESGDRIKQKHYQA